MNFSAAKLNIKVHLLFKMNIRKQKFILLLKNINEKKKNRISK